MPHADTVLLGRRTYELFAGFWPHALDDSGTAPDPHHPGRRSPQHHAIAVWLNQATKLVFSRTLKDVTWHNSLVLDAIDPRAIEAMKATPGKDMMIFGSGSIVSQLTRHGLIDEYQLMVCPVLLGTGRSLLGGVSKPVKLELMETRRYPSGDVLLRYGRWNAIPS
jgi:dihydrofolate reductase